ncbi:MAG: Uma2 family endonuclease [Saprospiraceae bacterium]|nr:Uma2 family endonuclease [Saprospiraceae bacterium]
MLAIAEKKVTVQEFLERDDFEEGFLHELIDGEIVKKQAPSPEHQNASGNLFARIHQFNREKQLGGKYLTAPLDVYFTEIDYYQPDIIFISKAKLAIITPDGIEGTPDLVVEILSPGTYRHDRDRKMKVYRRTGVQEYWIVDPKSRSVEVYALREGDYKMTDFATEKGTVQSTLLEGLQVDLDDIFG